MNTQEAAARFTQQSLDELLYTIKKTPDDKLTWKPAETSRTMLNVAAECAVVMQNWTKIIATLEFPSDEEFAGTFNHLDDYETREKVVGALKEAAAGYVAMVGALSDEHLQKELKAPWASAPVAAWVFHAAGHNQYHLGQIAYIQTLYGDTEE